MSLRTKIIFGCALPVIAALVCLSLGGISVANAGRSASASPKPAVANTSRERDVKALAAQLPLSFERNVGQLDAKATLAARGSGYNLFLTSSGAVLELHKPNRETSKSRRESQSNNFSRSVVTLKLKDANPNAAVRGVDALCERRNYFLGSDPAKWRTNVPTFRAVSYDEIYPGVSLTWYGNQKTLEYDFVVAAGADPQAIRIVFDSNVRLSISSEGELVIRNSGGEIRQQPPVIYQDLNGERRSIDGRYILFGRREVGFEIGEYDRSRPLVIDPTLVYSTYFGGGGDDQGGSIAVDSSNNVYITGTTASINFPTQNAAFATNAGLGDIFVTKIDAAGANVIYSTYVGGSGQDRGDGIAIDSGGSAYVVGRIDSSSINFPSTVGSFASTYRGGDFDGVVFKLNPQGNALTYSGFLGGEENDSVEGVVVSAAGDAYVTGGTKSVGFPTTINAYQGTRGGDTDAFLTKISASGGSLLYSTYLGGTGTDRGSGVAIDGSGKAFLSGFTASGDFPTDNAFQSSFGGSFDAFFARFDTNLSGQNSLLQCSYLGGSGDDKAFGIAIDSSDNAYVVGQTSSVNFPLLNPVQPASGGGFDAFIAKISTGGSKVYASYLGGSGEDRGTGVAVNSAEAVYVTGFTSSTNFPTASPLQITNGGGFDAFITKLHPLGNALLYSTYLGGSANESNVSTVNSTNPIALDTSNNAYLVGYTSSSNFPTVAPLQPAKAAGQDAFIVKVSDAAPAADYLLQVLPATRTVVPGGSTTYTVNATPQGGFTGTISLSLSGLSNDANSNFVPSSITITNASAQSATLNVITTGATPPGTYPLTINTTSGNLQHSAPTQLIVSGTASSNLAITKTASPNPATSLSNLTYRITVTNNGPSPATGVSVTDILPAGVTFVSAVPTQGTPCTGATTVTCNLGGIASGAFAIVNITVNPPTPGQLSNTASVAATENDPDTSDNSVTIQTNVSAPSSGPSMLDPNLSVTTVVSGLSQPTSMAFIGPGAFFVLEKNTGKVMRIAPAIQPSAVLDLAVNSASERGLLGIALHPNFASNGYVYLYWTESSTGADSTSLSDVFQPISNRVDRYLWNGSTLTLDRNLIKLRAYQADANQPLRGNHNGGPIRFGPDGKLYLMMGDNGRRGFLQNVTSGAPVPDDQFGGPEPDDAHLTGFILRLNDDGSTPTDNPFFNAVTPLTGQAAANIKKLYAYGVRNGFGLAFDPLSGNLWDQENGDDAFDEMNRVTAGSNNGWVQMMGPNSRVAQFKQIETSYGAGDLQQMRWPPSLIANTPAAALAALYMLPGAHYNDPEFSWKYAIPASPLGFVQGRGLGPQFEGDMFVGAARTFLVGGFLFRFKLTPDRLHFAFTDSRLNDLVADNTDKFDITESETLLIGRDFGITTDIQTGPDGDLYIVSNTNSAVYRISGKQPALFTANLTGAQETPPNNSTATGSSTLLLSPDETTARVQLNFSGLTSAETAAHIHGAGGPGVVAPILFPLPQNNFSDFLINLTPQDVLDLKNGLFYVNVHSSNFPNGEIRGQFGSLAIDKSVQFNSANTIVSESAGRATITITRIGNTTPPMNVDYATSDTGMANNCGANNGVASSQCDYTTSIGTVSFGPGETVKTITIPLTDDAYVEGNETFTVTLSNPLVGFLGSPGTTTVTIVDNDSAAGANPIDFTNFFVHQHYIDFLNREPDQSGYTFWTGEIDNCTPKPQCTAVKRVNVSAAFFLSIEFQQTGYLVERLYKSAYGSATGTSTLGGAHQLSVPIVRVNEFLPDTQKIGQNVIVGQTGWEQVLENNKVAFTNEFVQRARFGSAYANTLTPTQFVTMLFANAGVTPTPAEQQAAIDEFGGAATSANTAARARALRRVAENPTLFQQESNRAFVLAEYFGYLRRNPNDLPDVDYTGYDFWLTKLNQFNGNFQNADMVKAFLNSGEYRQRFGL